MTIINDASTGKSADVNSFNRLMTSAEVIDFWLAQASRGNCFSFSSGNIRLTSDQESAIFYIKNISLTMLMIIEEISVNIGDSSNPNGFVELKELTNIISGTILNGSKSFLLIKI